MGGAGGEFAGAGAEDHLMRLGRSIPSPPDDIVPNPNDPASVPPATVGPPAVTPGDPHGVTLEGNDAGSWAPPPRITPMPWSGWPAEWALPNWGGQQFQVLTDTAWTCLDKNANALAAMPPYLVGAAASLGADWLNNPDPDVYVSWEEFIKQVFWDYQLGEAFILATSYYATGWPARFHVVPPWQITVQMMDGLRRYSIGGIDVTANVLHIRYQSVTNLAHGIGPLEAGSARLIAANVLTQYASTVASTFPPSVLMYGGELAEGQAELLKAQWVSARMSGVGLPAVLEAGITWQPTATSPKDMALVELSQFNEARIAVMLGVPPFMLGLPAGDSMTYKNATSLFDYYWRDGLKPKAQTVMSALSGWALPRNTRVELNRDAYVQADLLERAQTYQILHSIVDPATGQQAMTVQEIRDAERLGNSTPPDVDEGVLK